MPVVAVASSDIAPGTRADARQSNVTPIVATAGQACGQNPAFSALSRLPEAGRQGIIPGKPAQHARNGVASAATKLLDHIDGWQKVYADDIATPKAR
jgi:hypothetical protein